MLAPNARAGAGRAPPDPLACGAMAIRAVMLDLFDTVVDLLMEDLPEFEVGGRVLRGTHGSLHEIVSQHSDVDLESFVRLMVETDREFRVPLYEQGREYPTLQRFRQLSERLGIDAPGLPERLTEAHMDAILAQARYLPHHVDVLRTLRERAKIGICSNFSHTGTGLRVLERAGLAPHVDAVAISEEVGIRKPRPEIFRAALERLGVEPHETLHVGDRLEADVQGAAEVGITPVWITRRVRDPEQALRAHEGPKPAHVIADLAELLPLVS